VIRQDRDLEDRKQTFAALNDFVSARQGWLTSVPGDIDIRLEAVPDATLPVALRGLGYIVEPIGRTQRILPHAIIESLVTTSSGALAAATEGSTRPVTTRITHAGLATVIQYSLSTP
jgi:hypothetical protein